MPSKILILPDLAAYKISKSTNDCSLTKKIPLNVIVNYGLLWNPFRINDTQKIQINKKIIEFHEENEFDTLVSDYKKENSIGCIYQKLDKINLDGIYSGSLIIFIFVYIASFVTYLVSAYYEKKSKLSIRAEGNLTKSEEDPIDMKQYNSLIAFEHIIKNYGYKFHQKVEDTKVLFSSNKESIKAIGKQVEDMIKLIRIKRNNSIKSRGESGNNSPFTERNPFKNKDFVFEDESLIQD